MNKKNFLFPHEKTIKCPKKCLKLKAKKRAINNCPECNGTGYIVDPDTILCNNCGGTMLPVDYNNNINYAIGKYTCGLTNITAIGDYESYHLNDMTDYHFNLCEKCLRNMFGQFKIKPYVNNFNADGVDYKADEKIYKMRLWCDSEEYKVAAKNGFCTRSIKCKNKAVFSISEKGSGFSYKTSCKSCFDKNKNLPLNFKIYPHVPFVYAQFE